MNCGRIRMDLAQVYKLMENRIDFSTVSLSDISGFKNLVTEAEVSLIFWMSYL